MSWWQNLTEGLKSSTQKITSGISDLLTKEHLDEQVLEDLEELLLSTDMGLSVTTKIIDKLRMEKFDSKISDLELRQIIADTICEVLEPAQKTLDIEANRPHIIMMVGVNGSGKTTTMGKMAHNWVKGGKSIIMAACDTFRAAATEQLEQWAKRANCPIVKGQQGADAAALAFQALDQACDNNSDLLLIDTAGRLHNKSHLMAELDKIKRVISKKDPEAPHDIILVLDGTTGQNALSQVEIFNDLLGISGLIITKLDGTSKGGVLINIVEKFNIPVIAIGVGEKPEDLQPFSPQAFASSLVGIINHEG